jgi:hypothetical protein
LEDHQINHLGLPRPLRDAERDLIRYLLRGFDSTSGIDRRLSQASVQDWLVGDRFNSGSVRFSSVNQRPHSHGKIIAEAEYVDGDEVPVSITVSIDEAGNLFELDLWKVDFNPLQRYPRPADLKTPEP